MSRGFDYMSLMQQRHLVAQKQVSPVELTRRALERAEETEPHLNSFYFMMVEEALAAARNAEDAVMKGTPLGLLHGIPFSVKDLIPVGGVRYSSGSRTMADNRAESDAPSVERAKAEGAILIGKTTSSEFGCKPVGDSPLTGITRNPWNPAMTPGGSSAGAASSVAAGVTSFGLGTDGGGSIRIPCAFTGLSGIKGTFARVPVWPTSAAPTLVHVGPLARSVKDAALAFTAIAGHDLRDPFSIASPVPDLLGACDASIKGMRIAWSPTLGYARPDAEVVNVVEAAAYKLEQLGAHVELVETVFATDPANLWTAEFYAGVGTKLGTFLQERRKELDPAVAEILEPALSQNMQDYYATVFKRYALRDRMREFFEQYDALISPVLPVASLEVSKNMPEHLSDRNLVSWVYYTYPFNLTGQPAMAVCAGIAKNSMPVGMQIAGPHLAEASIVSIAAAVERTQPKDYNIRRFEPL